MSNVKGKLKKNYLFWQNTIKVNDDCHCSTNSTIGTVSKIIYRKTIFFKFDLKNEYHNVGILTEHSEYLGFSCEL